MTLMLKNLVGRGSGESVQMSFAGQGWVLVQPSEGRIFGNPSGGGGASWATWAAEPRVRRRGGAALSHFIS
jgi:hypothetical protein